MFEAALVSSPWIWGGDAGIYLKVVDGE